MILAALLLFGSLSFSRTEIPLQKNWMIQSSRLEPASGVEISTAGFSASGWYSASMPSTVLAAQSAQGAFGDLNVGMNLRLVPGMDYDIGLDFAMIPMLSSSPYSVPWWFRNEFPLPQLADGEHVFLDIDSINYSADLYVNGQLAMKSGELAGAFRKHIVDITPFAKSGANVVAMAVNAPTPRSLGSTWVDWSPMPADKNMGIWGPVSVVVAGPVVIGAVQVNSQLLKSGADIEVSALLTNSSNQDLQGKIVISFEESETVSSAVLAAGSSGRNVMTFHIDNPRLWWPRAMGTQNLYKLNVRFELDGRVTDLKEVVFGVRQITSELTASGARLFRVNGIPIMIRGAGWAPDILLRYSNRRVAQELDFVDDLNLNTVRIEGQYVPDQFLNECDRRGILVIFGWPCCNRWEKTLYWSADDLKTAELSLRDQIYKYSNHPSTLAFLYGSDHAPFKTVETAYLKIFEKEKWPNPALAAASSENGSGLKMTGPYDYVPPSYWIRDMIYSGAFGFNSETSPGPSMPELESIKKFIPPDHRWPIDEVWNYHNGGTAFSTLRNFNRAIRSRYGTPLTLPEYVKKAQVLSYENHRAMFEAYSQTKYSDATGLIQWMLNNSWPSFFWHLYDYYLNTGGAYFGAKKANEPMHIQYSYDDRNIVVVNQTYQDFTDGFARAQLFDFSLNPIFDRTESLSISSDSSQALFSLPDLRGEVSFLKLELFDHDSKLVSSNFYWLWNRLEEMDWSAQHWFVNTPTLVDADLTLLNSLPPVKLNVSSTFVTPGEAKVRIENPSDSLAFFVRAKITRGENGDFIAPVLWSDNYISIFPKDSVEISAKFNLNDLQGADPTISVDGWNIIQ